MTVQPIAADTPMGANLVPGGTTFRVWAPTADAVHIALHGAGHPDPAHWRPEAGNKLIRDQNGYWGGLVPGVGEGALYRFWTVGPAGSGYKRDPRARELELRGYPDCDGVVRGPTGYPWHDAGFRPPPFHELIVYQLHIGVFYASDGQKDIRAEPRLEISRCARPPRVPGRPRRQRHPAAPGGRMAGQQQPRLQQYRLLLAGDGPRARARGARAVPRAGQSAPAQEGPIGAAAPRTCTAR